MELLKNVSKRKERVYNEMMKERQDFLYNCDYSRERLEQLTTTAVGKMVEEKQSQYLTKSETNSSS